MQAVSQTNYDTSLENQLAKTLLKMNEMFADVKSQIQEVKNQSATFVEKAALLDNITTQIEGLKKDQQTIVSHLNKK